VSAFDDLSMWPDLIHEVQPIGGEGLGELLLRATSENGYQKTDWILSLCGRKGTRLSNLLSRPASDLAPLAKVLGLKRGQNDLVPLLHPSKMPGWIEFFGTQLRSKYLDLVHRRVSPSALRQSCHLRAMWAIKILSFDPGTKELLLDRCPVCDRRLNFRSVIEIWSCANCERIDDEGFRRAAVDLRDFPQPVVEVDDLEGLDFVTGLVDPDPQVRASFRPNLDRDLEAMSRGELFEVIVAICCALCGDAGGNTTNRSLWRPRNSEGYRKFTPQLFAKAGRALLGWPDAFHRLAEDVRSNAGERPGYHGIQKELGPLLSITFDCKVPRLACTLIRKALEDNMAMTASAMPTARGAKHRYRDDLITMQDAADELSVCRQSMSKLSRYPGIEVFRSPTGTSPVLFRRKQIEDILQLKSQLLPSTRLAVELGIPRSALRELSLAGLLERERAGPSSRFFSATTTITPLRRDT
jgi:hypothetical protein